MNELLPCPFCGASPRVFERFESDNSCRMETAIFCPTDDCPGPEMSHRFPSKAIELWNKRKETIHA